MDKEKKPGNGLETKNFKISGICSCEFKIIEKKMRKLNGIESYTLNPITNLMKVTFDGSKVSVDDIQKAASKAGAKATLMDQDQIF